MSRRTLEPAAASEHSKPQRSILIDVVRGISISLVALGHTNQGIIRRGWWDASQTGLHLNVFVYAFHMPAFFFVSGIFLCASVAKRGAGGFTVEKLRTMIYPYLIWASIFAVTPAFFGRFMNERVPSLHDFAVNLATGELQWFLPTIFFVVVAGMLLRKVPMPLLFVLTAALSFFWHPLGITFLDLGVLHLPFLVVGMWVGRRFEAIERVPAVVAALAAIVLFVIIAVVTASPLQGTRGVFLPLGLAGTLMLLCVARCMNHTAQARWLAWAGSGSLGIFLVSPFFQGGGREFLLRVCHTTRAYPQLLLPTLLAIVVPAWIYQNRVRLRVGWLFVWPLPQASGNRVRS